MPASHSHVLQLDVQGTPQAWISIEQAATHHASGAVAWFDGEPPVAKDKLFRRDRLTCAYCGLRFPERDLQCEHILPESRGGAWSWMNLVTACASCNGRKAARTPEEARMPLLYLPYVPSRFEDFLLAGRNIRADVHDWLAARLPKASRLS